MRVLQVIGPLRDGEEFVQEDFDLLEKRTKTSSTDKLETKIRDFGLEDDR